MTTSTIFTAVGLLHDITLGQLKIYPNIRHRLMLDVGGQTQGAGGVPETLPFYCGSVV